MQQISGLGPNCFASRGGVEQWNRKNTAIVAATCRMWRVVLVVVVVVVVVLAVVALVVDKTCVLQMQVGSSL